MKSHDKGVHRSLLLSLPFTEGTGTATQDVAKSHHPITMVHAPVWTQLASGIWVLDFDGANDYLECPAASSLDLDFTSGDFSLACWCYFDDMSVTRSIMARDEHHVSGWALYSPYTFVGGALFFRTSFGGVPASSSVSASGVLAASKWQLVGCSRAGIWPELFVDGTPVPVVFDGFGLTDPASSGEDLVIGTKGTKDDHFFDGKLWNPRLWNRSLTHGEHKAMFHRERHLFNV